MLFVFIHLDKKNSLGHLNILPKVIKKEQTHTLRKLALKIRPGMVVYTYNPSYSRHRGWRIMVHG
jgi:hypothetical protein